MMSYVKKAVPKISERGGAVILVGTGWAIAGLAGRPFRKQTR
jgi:hypothetical protein